MYERKSRLTPRQQSKLDERYFDGVRKGKRGRGAAGKVAVFGLLKLGGKVCDYSERQDQNAAAHD